MTAKDVVQFWLESSNQEWETAQILFKNKKYHHALFFCHLSLEKILKGLIVKVTRQAPPLIHDLIRLAESAEIALTERHKDELAEITSFNIQTRYDDYKLSFYKKATPSFTTKYFNKTKSLLTWLNKLIKIHR